MATNSTGRTTANRATRRAAPKKAAAPKPAEAAPAGAHLSLADLEREARAEPFKVELLDGSVVEVGDPQDLDFELLSESDPFEAFERTMDPDDYDALIKGGLKAWQFRIVFEAWRQHFGLGTQGE